MKRAIAAAVMLGLTSIVRADPADIEKKVEDILAKIPVEKRIELLGGIKDFWTRPYPDAGLIQYKFTDGPVGTRNDGPSTAYPSDILLAATWDPELAKREGVALGRDARSRGDHVLLGPAVNIYRVPQNGRNFEYMGEDPYLAGKIAANYITGVQSQGVAACVKHFACNNQETLRDSINAIVDERALHEIYLPAFEAAVTEGHVQSIMCSYNRLNGEYASANHYLLTTVLRDQWHFDGLCMSDWGAVHDTLGPMNAGMDLEMPGPKYMNAKAIKPLMDDGKITQATVDEKLRRLIRVSVRMGWADRPQKDSSIPFDDEANDKVALAVAREGITLLKNDGGILPLDRTKIKTLAVVGPGADRYVAGGGSSETKPARPVTVLQGIQKIAGPGVQIISVPTVDTAIGKMSGTFEPVDGAKPLKAVWFNNTKLEGEPAATTTDDKISFDWKRKKPLPAITGEHFSVRWTGRIKPATTGQYLFATRSDDGSRVLIDGKTVIDNWADHTAKTVTSVVDLEAGRSYELTVEYYNGALDASMVFGWMPKPLPIPTDQLAAVKSADAVICCVRSFEGEGSDRPYDLDDTQLQLLDATIAANPKTIVLLNGGGNVGMEKWVDRVPALLHGFYAGQAGGTATAEILFGDVNPSGHLPATFEKKWEDSFAHDNYPGDKKDVKYAEGIFVGYRYYDTKKIEPRFPFGYGMSYTQFKVAGFVMIVDARKADDMLGCSVIVTNTGQRAGATVVQMYIRPPAGSDRPMQELKGFARVELAPGQSENVSFALDDRALSTWDVATHQWKILDGEFEVAIGQSSRSIDVAGKFTRKSPGK